MFFLNCLERARLKPAEPWAQGKYGPVALPTHNPARHIHRNTFADLSLQLRAHAYRHDAKTKMQRRQYTIDDTRKISWVKGEGTAEEREIGMKENLIYIVLLLSAIYCFKH